VKVTCSACFNGNWDQCQPTKFPLGHCCGCAVCCYIVCIISEFEQGTKV
jgi:hypothetical protein